ncbi:MAG: histidine kinase [Pseudomonadota bacterium]
MMSNDSMDKGRLFLKDIGYTAVFNTVIAVFLTLLFRDHSFWNYLVMSQAIGLSICTVSILAFVHLRPKTAGNQIVLVGCSILAGSFIGGSLGQWWTGLEMIRFFPRDSAPFRMGLLSLLFGSGVSYFFLSRRTLADTRDLVQQERIQRLTSEKLLTQAQLKMLQAQIEPHFLFNTLSNILSLLNTDVSKGKTMLQDLTRYLRASLAETRSPWTTLGGELDQAMAYLNIFKVRMGHRLEFRIDIDDGLRQAVFAPMLLQPLVENAVIHGIDPEIDGGNIRISAQREDTLLRVEITDTGCGFSEHPPAGMAITNIRERLKALYGKAGRLILAENRPRGVRAVIEVPYAENL